MRTITTLVLLATLALPAAALACDREAAPTTAAAEVAPMQATLVTLRMEAVSCGSCIVPIRQHLTALAGVFSVEGNEADVKEIVVSIDKAKVTHEQLVAAVKTAGYDAVVKPAAKNS